MTLWCIFPSPLMVGGRLPDDDAWSLSLLTNLEVLAVDQHSTGNRPVITSGNAVVWRAESADGYYLAAFNISDSSQSLHYDWKNLGLKPGRYKLRDLWTHRDLEDAESLILELPSHASVLYSAVAIAKK